VYPVHCEEPGHEAALLEALDSHLDARPFRRWSEFVEASRVGTCSIVEAEELSDHGVHQRLFRFCAHPALRPLVLVTVANRDNARRATDLHVDELVWLDEVRDELAKAVERAEQSDLLAAYARAVRERDRMQPQLERALVAALTAPDPIPSQKELLQHAHCHRSTLTGQWRAFAPDGPPLKRVLDWILLVRASSRVDRGASWGAVAAELSISRRTLSNLARRLMGAPPGRLDAASVREAFERSASGRLLRG